MAIFIGGAGNDSLIGSTGDDGLTGFGGNDTLDGGAGTDTAIFTGPLANYAVFRVNATTTWVGDLTGVEGIDTLQNIESLTFQDQAVANSYENFNPLSYIASYADLMNAFGADPAAGFSHYVNSGHAEGRTVTFDALQYIASYGDLMNAFGADRAAGALHYINAGHQEGRTATFDALQYIASYGDLMNAFGADRAAGALHYINAGHQEGRTATFDALQYIASYGDLINAFGTNQAAATLHYINAGHQEGRTATFDALQYLASYADLAAAFGTDQAAATLHYINNGYSEGRTAATPGVLLLGGDASDSLTGGAGNDTLNGGLGNDTMVGGAGNDLYVIDATGDVIIDSAGADTVQITGNIIPLPYTLGTGIENLVFNNFSSNKATGNSLNNIMTATHIFGSDTLDGGAGNDTMIGGGGMDLYMVDSAGDVIIEASGGGMDRVLSSVDYTLSAEVEDITLTGGVAVVAVGNIFNNSILGNSISNKLSGGAGNDTLNGGLGADTMAGGVGDDIYFVDEAGDVVIELGGEGTDTVNSAVSFALTDTLEKLIFTAAGTGIIGIGNSLNNTIVANSLANILIGAQGNDSLSGQNGNDSLDGGDGDDTLNGGLGADSMSGGLGDDYFMVDSGLDVVIDSGGNDTVEVAGGGYTMADGIENARLTGSGSSIVGNGLNNVITGTAAANTLSGGGGNDTLDGGFGSDMLSGGAGNDVYIVSSSTAVINEVAGEGIDTVLSLNTFTLLDNTEVENLTLTSGSPSEAYGNNLANVLTGNYSANVLDGRGGADTLIGGLDNDIYIADAADILVEGLNEGLDTVQSDAGYALTWKNIENLTLTGTAAIDGTGNSLNNVILGNSLANLLNGLDGDDTLDGGLGIDTLAGGNGNDYYKLDGTDILGTETGGFDTIEIATAYTLSDLNYEGLVLSGSASVAAVGNSLNNILTGNAGTNLMMGLDGNDTLSGGGGTDYLIGGLGDDVYINPSATSVFVENANQGTDTIRSNVSFALGAAVQIENLTLTGADLINGTGNSLNNVITGNSANNTLSGGNGTDTLVGGQGGDTYTWDGVDIITELPGGGIDTVQFAGSYTLTDLNLENVRLLEGGTFNAVGNALNNVLTGNNSDNILTGLDGNDTLDGGSGGNDTLIGGLGNDYYKWDGSDTIVDAGGSLDIIELSLTFNGLHTLTDSFEGAVATGSNDVTVIGNSSGNWLVGNAGANVLMGLEGDDTLIGGIGANDTLNGGLGDDVYIDPAFWSVIVEIAGEGKDTILSGANLTLGNNLQIENLILTGVAEKGGGNSLNNVITGTSMKNTLSGGLGIDTLIGGAGFDTYIWDGVDIIVEHDDGGGGINPKTGKPFAGDTVMYAGSYTLTDLNLENIELIGTGEFSAMGQDLADNILTGNSLANLLTGLGGDDTLDGGLGVDTLVGGLGNDYYIWDGVDIIVDSGGDLDIIEILVPFGGSYTLDGDGPFEGAVVVEHNPVTLIGNSRDNWLFGNGNHNGLYGLGGNDTLLSAEYTDTLFGGEGDDVYEGNFDFSVIVVEAAGGGIDTLLSDFSFDLTTSNHSQMLTSEIENLTLINSLFFMNNGVYAIGNSLNNVITGNYWDNTLSGMAGNDTLNGWQGNDTLNGGLGADTYVFGESFGRDTIQVAYTNSQDVVNMIEFASASVTASIGGVGGDDLILTAGADTVTITDWNQGDPGYKLNTFIFSDGTKATNGTGWL